MIPVVLNPSFSRGFLQTKPATRVGFCPATLWKRILWFNLQGKIQILQSSNIILRIRNVRQKGLDTQHDNGPGFWLLGYGKIIPVPGVLFKKKRP